MIIGKVDSVIGIYKMARKQGREINSCGCDTSFYFEPFEIIEQELCYFHFQTNDMKLVEESGI